MSHTIKKMRQNPGAAFLFKRSRLINLFTEAMKYPLIVVCAGAGYGKTTAVHDFTKEYKAATIWVQLSERDNVGGRFWENFSHSMAQINVDFAASIKKLGFPDTTEKLKQYLTIMNNYTDKKRRIIVFDDCHFIENNMLIRFVEEAIRNLPLGINVFLISRSTPRINIAGLVSNDRIFEACEDELRFTEDELALYFRGQGITLKPNSLRSIWQDTEGWAFAINYIARSFNKAPGYEGYLRNAMKTNIFRFMEVEVWDATSSRLQNFLVRLSLIDHLSVDLIVLLAGEDTELVDDLEKQSAYVRRDSYINAFLIHPLFLEFLAAKQDILSCEQKTETYRIAARWCNKNSFKIDALSYYEKIGDYKSIVQMFDDLPVKIPYDIACFASVIFDRAPEKSYDTVEFLVSKHLNVYMSQGLWQKAIELAESYETKYLKLLHDDPFVKLTLATIYYNLALTHFSLCLTKETYDFDIYFDKLNRCFSNPVKPGKLIKVCPGPWLITVGSSEKGAPEKFINAYTKSQAYLLHCFNGYETGEDDLARGELKFYQNDISAAEKYIASGLDRARKNHQHEVEHRALFYLLRIAIYSGDHHKADQVRKEMKAQLDEADYDNRFINFDISMCWYYCNLRLSEKVPGWLKENISFYAYAGFIENYANQMKARYCYITRYFPPLLSYINDMKLRESYLFGRIEMLAIEACIHYKMKDKKKAAAVFEEAYNCASPNNIIMPFIELGKDMRTLSAFALKNTEKKIPDEWLEDIKRKSASYAKRLAHIVTEYKQSNRILNNVVITPRESEILTDLSHGLSRAEIAASRNLSINTVKMLVNNVYMKLGAENLAEAIRIASERKFI